MRCALNYRYTDIRDDQVRLLYIKPGRGDDEVCATLQAIDDAQLGSDGQQYEALSYHWGNGTDENPIIIQDDFGEKPIQKFTDLVEGVMSLEGIRSKRLYVRPNLYEALKTLRRPDMAVPLWVDALCINQGNMKEKKVQVMKMAKIYRSAVRVCIWLGMDDVPSKKAMLFIKKIVKLENFGELLKDTSPDLPDWKHLFELLKWSWFSRRWVIQELALAKEATVHCGNHVVHWHDFRDAIGIFFRYFNVLQHKLTLGQLEPLGAKLLVDVSSNILRRQPNGTFQSTIGLQTLVCKLSSFDTSDPRDTIHALRNISMEYTMSSKSLPLEPDYSKDLFEVYKEFTEWAVEDSGSLDIICRHWALPERTDRGPTTPRLVTLPSWIKTVDDAPFGKGDDVLKGRKAGDSFVGLPGKSYYNASGGKLGPKIRFGHKTTPVSPRIGSSRHSADPSSQEAIHDMSLYAEGLLIGNVEYASDPIPDGVIPQKCLEKAGWTPSNRNELDSAPEQLWRTLVADRGPNGTEVPTYYHRACLHCLVNRTANGHINTRDLLKRKDFQDQQSIVQDYLERVQAVTWDRSFLEVIPPKEGQTVGQGGRSDKMIGLGPSTTKQGDLVVILYGCSVPCILRPCRSALAGRRGMHDYFQFIGEAYIYGKMDGEAMFDAHIEKEFRIW
ncbi:heterokaryon incompatibility protein-domain-containing protein [Clohesyomyces aquaticus]|uniref:Heterokaryon incompatibility protein-domain-containing protein n=1 Tax=Clohesyomyces aquaticus TaxID=1231657 RepID=A0A1Y1Z022_9PLEO|nr:heterokaryon incompatibility protein-domain-containing protein [Clohesyomyces aquaticus]